MIELIMLLLFHGPGGQKIAINPEEVVSIREPRADEGHFPKGVRCIVNTADGKFSTVLEDCDTVRQMIKERNDQ